MTRIVAAQHYSESDGKRLRLYDIDGCLLPELANRLDEAPRRKTLIVARSNTTAHLPVRSQKARSNSFWRNLLRTLGSAEKVCGYVSRATAQAR